MAAYNGIKDLEKGVWTQLNASEVDAILFQNRGNSVVEIYGTPTDTAPELSIVGIEYVPGTGENMTLADYFKGVTDPKYLWGLTRYNAGKVFVSHA
ncbi:hypothetical protein [Roseobacter sp. N2S]|uniref:hypothetical protein n=1 Tax=Roseobacter sp. N2S TaxID=2663844 RepID=UPI0028621B4F|nr:hypothetical protein [Roseobacter sp. N2S]MDR6266528.1 hypothetical protein [Roseobacter sp. N2S]